MSKSKGWTFQSSLLMLWMDKTRVNNQTRIAGQDKLTKISLMQQPNWPKLLLHGEYKQGLSEDDVLEIQLYFDLVLIL